MREDIGDALLRQTGVVNNTSRSRIELYIYVRLLPKGMPCLVRMRIVVGLSITSVLLVEHGHEFVYPEPRFAPRARRCYQDSLLRRN